VGENANIQKMAELLSTRLFREFFWEKVGPENQSWKCEDKNHNKSDHPADTVFFYDEPYSAKRTYVHTDLKSYGSSSLSNHAIQKAFDSLVQQVACAEKSQEWCDLYMHKNVNPEVVGLLFVYNHDNNYTQDFKSLLRALKLDGADFPKGSRIFVMGPEDVLWLNNIRNDLIYMRGGGEGVAIPGPERCSFYYPQMVRKANINIDCAKAATLEMLLSPWTVFYYRDENERDGYIIYYRESGSTEEEFVYLIDYLRHHQILSADTDITIKMLGGSPALPSMFEKAKKNYIETFSYGRSDTSLASLVSDINIKIMENKIPNFEAIEIGMGER